MSKSSLPSLLDAIRREDDQLARTIVSHLLDHGDEQTLRSYIEEAPWHVVDKVSELIESEAQSCTIGGERVTLFAMPVFADKSKLTEMPTKALTATLSRFLGKGERLLLVDDWFITDEVMALHPVAARRATKAIAAYLSGPMAPREAYIDNIGFPVSDMFDKSMETIYLEEDPTTNLNAIRVIPRFIVGILATDPEKVDPGIGFSALLSGKASKEMLDSFGESLETVLPDVLWWTLEPAEPVKAAVHSQTFLQIMRLEARLMAAIVELGHAPIAHYAIEDGELHLVLTVDGDRVIDAMVFQGPIMDTERVASIVNNYSQGMVEHESVASLPRNMELALN